MIDITKFLELHPVWSDLIIGAALVIIFGTIAEAIDLWRKL